MSKVGYFNSCFVIITTIPDLSLQYDEFLGLLRIEWASGEDMRTFRPSLSSLLELARELGPRLVLMEMNTFPDISVYDQVWLGLYWMPGVVKLPLERVVLAIHRSRVHNQLAIDSLIALSRPFIKFDIQFFTTGIAGLRWLCDFSEHLPGLLAEWDAVHDAALSAAPGSPTESHFSPLAAPRPIPRPLSI